MLYTNNLKNREFDKEAPQNFCLEQVTIAEGQGTSEDNNSEVKPTRSKTDSSSCLCIKTLLFISSIAASLSIEATPKGEIENSMPYTMEKQQRKLIMGIQIRTSNDVCQTDMPRIWQKFLQEKILEKIPNKVGNTIFAVYTDYEDDFTKPYSYIVGCEVSTLDSIPEGLVGTIVPASSYAVYKTQGEYPQGLASTWQMIWKAPFKRAYTTDFEVYNPDFNPQTKPEVKVYIAH